MRGEACRRPTPSCPTAHASDSRGRQKQLATGATAYFFAFASATIRSHVSFPPVVADAPALYSCVSMACAWVMLLGTIMMGAVLNALVLKLGVRYSSSLRPTG